MGILFHMEPRNERGDTSMPDVPTVENEKEGTVSFSEIEKWKFYSMQPEGFILQKVSAVHFLPVSVKCKYRAMLMDQGERVYPRIRFA